MIGVPKTKHEGVGALKKHTPKSSFQEVLSDSSCLREPRAAREATCTGRISADVCLEAGRRAHPDPAGERYCKDCGVGSSAEKATITNPLSLCA